MRTRFRAFVVGTFLAATSILSADGLPAREQPMGLVGSQYVFPSLANVQGIGAYFRTRMVLTNMNDSALTVIAVLMSPTGQRGLKTVGLASHETRTWEDFLGELFGYTGGGGVWLIDEGSALSGTPRPFLAVAEVYTDGVRGRTSTPVTGLLPDDRIVDPAVEAGYSLVTGLRADSGNRVNFGCANNELGPARVRAEIYASDSPGFSAPVAVEEFSLVENGWSQKALPVQDGQFRILFRAISGAGYLGIYCYGVNVNNSSNDGTSIPAAYVRPFR